MANHLYYEALQTLPTHLRSNLGNRPLQTGLYPSEKSLVQRYLYLQAGWNIASEHLLMGVGNGDVEQEFQAYYDSIDSPLEGNGGAGPTTSSSPL